MALGTMHAKERAISKPFARILRADLVVPGGIDTDAFGTFTGEIERFGTMLDAARAKARAAMTQTGLRLGLASEGSYGPHPYLPFIPGGTEVVLFIDDERDLEVREAVVVTRTNYDSVICTPDDDLGGPLLRMRFPSHAVTVRPNTVQIEEANQGNAIAGIAPDLTTSLSGRPLFKGVQDREAVARAVEICALASADGRALLVPDMRAHLNPTRMVMIRVAARKLAKRIASLCPRCKTPGFGIVDVARGLPCADCGEPTQLAVAEIYRCAACAFEASKPLWEVGQRASPVQCEFCNP